MLESDKMLFKKHKICLYTCTHAHIEMDRPSVINATIANYRVDEEWKTQN